MGYDAKLDGYLSEMVYEVFVSPDGYRVVKRSFVREEVLARREEVLARGLTKEAAVGFIKLLKEE